jgi:hypothetical protein
MRRSITKHTKIVPINLSFLGEIDEQWHSKMRSEGVDVTQELNNYKAYIQQANYDDVIPGEVDYGETYIYFPDVKTYNWFVLKWGT